MSSWDVPKLRRNIGTVFQDYKLLTDKTVFENVAFALEVIGKPKHVIDQRVPEILEYVGLGDKLNNYPDELSGGEQQRVSIARACVNRPLVLLADEPTGNLDPNTSAWTSCGCSTRSTASAPPWSWPPTTRPSSMRCASA